MTALASLLLPVARWHAEYGFTLADQAVRAVLDRGGLGALVTDGPATEVLALTTAWRAQVDRSLIIAAELGGGVGERFDGATALPPLAAFDIRDLESVRRAAVLTAREARGAGISWALAPSCVDPTLASAIVRSRTFRGPDEAVTAAVAEWVDGCQQEGVVAVPGPYPLMQPAAAAGALDAGPGAMLLAAAHVHDADAIEYLRHTVGFSGVIIAPVGAVADQLHEDEEPIAVAALSAGADLLLGLEEPDAVERAIAAALRQGTLDRDALDTAAARVRAWADWCDPRRGGRPLTLEDALWARRAADAAVHTQRGQVVALLDPVEVVVVDDDPPRRVPAGHVLIETLQRLDHEARRVASPTGTIRGPVVVALFGDRRLALGFDIHSDAALARVSEVVARAEAQARDVIVVHFTPAELAAALPAWPTLVCGWGGTRAMEEAVARWLSRGDGSAHRAAR